MRALRHLSIRQKLLAITMLSCGLALVMVSVTLFVHEKLSMRRDRGENLTVTADLIAKNSAAALSFDDTTAARETLQALAADPQITMARIYQRNGRPFADYQRPDLVAKTLPTLAVAQALSSAPNGTLGIVRGIVP